MTKQSTKSDAAAAAAGGGEPVVEEKAAVGVHGVEATITEQQGKAIISMAKRAVEEEAAKAKTRGDGGAAAAGEPSLKRSLECFLESRKKAASSAASRRRRLESPSTSSSSSSSNYQLSEESLASEASRSINHHDEAGHEQWRCGAAATVGTPAPGKTITEEQARDIMSAAQRAVEEAKRGDAEGMSLKKSLEWFLEGRKNKAAMATGETQRHIIDDSCSSS
nr:unnamed protein product [Digitaria exilis]